MELEFKRLEVKKIDAPNFTMSPLELVDYIDFEPKRVYFISNPKGPTGAHCHLKEKELFVMAAGSATAVIDKGQGLEEIRLSAPSDAIYVGNYVWHHFKDFTPDAVVLAISSTNYSPNREDYIQDYAEYQTAILQMKKG